MGSVLSDIAPIIAAYLGDAASIAAQTCKSWRSAVQSSAVGSYRINIRDCVQSSSLIEWAINSGYICGKNTMVIAARIGRLDAIKYIHNLSSSYDYDDTAIFDAAAANRDVSSCIDTMSWLLSNKYVCGRYTFLSAVIAGSPVVVSWLRDHGCRVAVDSCNQAVIHNNLSVIEWLHDNGYGMSQSACSLAAGRGHLNTLKWLRNHEYQWGELTFVVVARGAAITVCEQIIMLNWLRKHNCPWGSRTFAAAATSGRQPIIEWLHNAGCPRDISTSAHAAFNGHLDLLKWLYARNYPWHPSLHIMAADAGQTHVLQWLASIG